MSKGNTQCRDVLGSGSSKCLSRNRDGFEGVCLNRGWCGANDFEGGDGGEGEEIWQEANDPSLPSINNAC